MTYISLVCTRLHTRIEEMCIARDAMKGLESGDLLCYRAHAGDINCVTSHYVATENHCDSTCRAIVDANLAQPMRMGPTLDSEARD
jgi:hypothetical protein